MATLLGEQLGTLGLSALVILATGFLFLSLALKPLESRNRVLDEALLRASADAREAPTGTRSQTGVTQIDAFYRFFRRSESLTDWLGRIDAAGRQTGLSLPSADYQSIDDGQHLLRYRIALPVMGTYVQVRAFLGHVLNDVPVLSLDRVKFRRAAPNSDRVEAEVTFTLYLPKS